MEIHFVLSHDNEVIKAWSQKTKFDHSRQLSYELEIIGLELYGEETKLRSVSVAGNLKCVNQRNHNFKLQNNMFYSEWWLTCDWVINMHVNTRKSLSIHSTTAWDLSENEEWKDLRISTGGRSDVIGEHVRVSFSICLSVEWKKTQITHHFKG